MHKLHLEFRVIFSLILCFDYIRNVNNRVGTIIASIYVYGKHFRIMYVCEKLSGNPIKSSLCYGIDIYMYDVDDNNIRKECAIYTS